MTMHIYIIIGFTLGLAFSVDYYFENRAKQQMLYRISLIMVLMTFGWLVFFVVALMNGLFNLLHK
jgi:predicted neutral ceramidase superfamily lipid hydrolase